MITFAQLQGLYAYVEDGEYFIICLNPNFPEYRRWTLIKCVGMSVEKQLNLVPLEIVEENECPQPHWFN